MALSLRIVLLFTMAIFINMCMDQLHTFFGDTYYKAYTHKSCNQNFEEHYHWGFRHILAFICSVLLFLIQGASIIHYASTYFEDNS